MYHIGVIGCGNRMMTLVNRILQYDDFCIQCICDTDCDAVKKRLSELSPQPKNYDSICYYTDAKKMLDEQKLDAVCIGTRCSTHTEFALLAAQYNIPIFLEKPVATTWKDAEKLKSILRLNNKIVVSFPLRVSKITRCVKEIVDSGNLGKIQHVQAYNNVPYGRGYYHKWYRDEGITGGLFLQKATHDLDYINYVLGDRTPVRICAIKSKQIFKGDKPDGLKCKDCAEQTTCPESPQNYGTPCILDEFYCCFARDTGNEDSGSAIIQYEDGMHVVYSQNFFVRKGAKKRGARFMGYNGTVEFDFYTGEVKVYYHNQDRVDTHTFGDTASHFGGDSILIENFVQIVRGAEESHSTLESGILSANMCLAAKKSSETYQFCSIKSGR